MGAAEAAGLDKVLRFPHFSTKRVRFARGWAVDSAVVNYSLIKLTPIVNWGVSSGVVSWPEAVSVIAFRNVNGIGVRMPMRINFNPTIKALVACRSVRVSNVYQEAGSVDFENSARKQIKDMSSNSPILLTTVPLVLDTGTVVTLFFAAETDLFLAVAALSTGLEANL